MHPIERLRYVARSGTAPDRILVAESMPALAQFSSEPNALLVSLRQLIARQPDSPGLLCLAANMVNALDSLEAGYEVVDAFDADRTTDIAEAAAFLASESASFITGHAQVVDGGISLGRPWTRQASWITKNRPITVYRPPGR